MWEYRQVIRLALKNSLTFKQIQLIYRPNFIIPFSLQQQIKGLPTDQGHQVSLLHDGVKSLAPLGARLHLLPEQVPGGQVRVPVLGDDLVALGPLATTRPA